MKKSKENERKIVSQTFSDLQNQESYQARSCGDRNRSSKRNKWYERMRYKNEVRKRERDKIFYQKIFNSITTQK